MSAAASAAQSRRGSVVEEAEVDADSFIFKEANLAKPDYLSDEVENVNLLHEEVVVDSSDMEVINRDEIEELVDTQSNEVVEEISEEVTNETTTEKIVAEGDDANTEVDG